MEAPSVEKKETPFDADQAAQSLAKHRSAIIEACGKELAEVLAKHGCILQVEMVIGEQGVRSIQKVVYVGKGQ